MTELLPLRRLAAPARRAAWLLVLAAVLAARPAAAVETQAEHAILVEWETGTILFEKAADTLMPPSSMSKMMTVYLVFEQLESGKLSLDDKLPVSKKAWKMGGSKMFVEVDTYVSVEDLLRGIIVQSGNDACIVVAEGLAGNEAAFAKMMNEKARELGLDDTHFTNSTGWPDPEHLTTARDLAALARHTIEDFPEYYHYYAETTFTYSGIRQGNRNPLLYKDMGADGLKTGHTEAAGYGLAASVKRGDRRLILVFNGLPSARARAQEAERLIEWGFREFDNYPLFAPGETVADAEVWLGDAAAVPLVVEEGLTVTLPREARHDMKVAALYQGPVPAPIAAGERIATLAVTAPDVEPIEAPLVAGESVELLGFAGRMVAAVKHLIFGSLR